MKSALFFTFAATLAFSAATASSNAACIGADPAIVNVAVRNVTTDGGLNEYHVTGTVRNLGSARQASNVLQFVDIYHGGQKMDNIGIPPLRPGQSYTFGWTFRRSTEAGDGTTTLHFRLRMTNPLTWALRQNCNRLNDMNELTF